MNVQRFLRNYLPGYSVLLALAGLTVATLVIHGYHVGVEDQAIYLPSILRALHPALFPHDAVLFEAQTSHTVITPAIVAIVRDGHLSLEWSLLLVHLFAIFLLLVGAWRVAHRCFGPSHSVWAGLAFLTALFLIPIAGTSQYIVDQYMHPRALSTALILLPVADFLPGEPRRRRPFAYAFAALCFALSFVLQLQMAVFGLGLLLFLAIPWERWMLVLESAVFGLVPMALIRQFMTPVSPAWVEAARLHRQHYLLRWQWYEWLGIIAPMFLFWWWAQVSEKRDKSVLAWFCRRLAVYGTLVLFIGGALVIPPELERLTVFQPMRMFTFIYFYMLLLGGGLLGELVLRKSVYKWVALFLPIVVGMYSAERALYPGSPHMEWPGHAPRTDWVQAFLWIRHNTPNDAYFALNPRYDQDKSEDARGFRAWALRSNMADDKDGGVACLVPAVAPRWAREMHARDDWQNFDGDDFGRLKRVFGVNWTVIEKPLEGGRDAPLPKILDCPYQNPSVYVCRIR